MEPVAYMYVCLYNFPRPLAQRHDERKMDSFNAIVMINGRAGGESYKLKNAFPIYITKNNFFSSIIPNKYSTLSPGMNTICAFMTINGHAGG